jgi:hypothetical protein
MQELLGLIWEKVRPAKDRMIPAETYEKPEETKEIVVFFFQAPINPVQGGVMAVSVIVPMLAAAELVSRQKHRHSLRQHENYGKAPYSPGPQPVY